MKRAAIFFDRDNTLIVNDGYLGNPDEVRLVPGAAEAVARAKGLGYAVVTVSNQSGVARGLFDEDAVRSVNQRMDKMLRTASSQAVIDRHEFCPFHPEAKVERYRQDSVLRKPKPGMILKAQQALDLDLSASWLVGDAPRDIEAGIAAGCRTILFVDPSVTRSPAADEGGVRPEFTVTTLKEALDIVEREGVRPAERVAPAAAKKGPAGPAGGSAAPPPPQGPRGDVKKEEGTGPVATARLETLVMQLVQEVKRRNEREHTDFSVAKLLAGIVQVIVLALLFLAYLGHQNAGSLQSLLLLSIVLQVMVASLLLMAIKR